MGRTAAISVLLAGCLMPTATHDALAASGHPLVGIVHVHTTTSTGTFSLEEIALRAEASGIDVVLLAENYHLQFNYNLLPLPGLLQISKSFPSLTQSTIAEYLNSVANTNRRHPKVLLIPGIETVPHYFWTGSLWRGNLTMHNGQKNILIMGLYRPEDYQGLPIIGNPEAARYEVGSLIRAAPLLFVFAGLGLLILQRDRRYRVGGFQVSRRRRPWRLALFLIITGAAWSTYNAPFTVPELAASRPNMRAAPYQALIDYVNRRGGATIWSYPEAKDFHVHTYPRPGRFGAKFVTKTDPHPDVLVTSTGYTAFGAIYQDNTTAERPGEAWDRALEQYCLGKRDRPVWGLGELGFHGRDRKALTDVLTMFYVGERTANQVLDALGAGRMYAIIPTRAKRIEVRAFNLTEGPEEAAFGETLITPPGESVTLHLALEAHDGKALPFRATLVRNGKRWRELEGTTPFSLALNDTPSPDRACTYYRLWMRSPHRLITNPLFAAPRREDISN